MDISNNITDNNILFTHSINVAPDGKCLYRSMALYLYNNEDPKPMISKLLNNIHNFDQNTFKDQQSN